MKFSDLENISNSRFFFLTVATLYYDIKIDFGSLKAAHCKIGSLQDGLLLYASKTN